MRAQGARTWQLAAIFAFAACLGLVLYFGESLGTVELESVDARFTVRGDEEPPSDIVLVEIDDATFDELNERWPFSRYTHANAIDSLTKDGAAAIAYDVQFTEPSRNRRADNELIKAVDRGEDVILATTEVGEGGESNVFGGDRVLRLVGARAGSAILPGDADGVVREIPRSDQGLDSFAVAAYEEWRDREVEEDGFSDGAAWIDFAGPGGTFEAVPFWRVSGKRQDDRTDERPKFESGTFTDKLVVVGASAPSLQDVHATATTGDELMSGPEIQANAIASIDRGNPLEEASDWLAAILIVLLAAIPPISSLRVHPIATFLLAVGLGVAYAAIAQLTFNAGTILPLIYPLLSLTVAAVGTLGLHYVIEALERRRVRDTFARFVPESVVDLVLERAGGELRLGGVEVTGTILFSDVRGFTSFSETQTAERVVEVLNRYLTEMSDAILDHGGTLVSYMGDGIMALFGAPIEQPDHADRALAAARAMLEEKLPRFNAWLREQGIDDFRMGIGLNTGSVMAGNVGSDRRLEYTAIGDTTNTASRLESMTKDLDIELVVAESTRSALADDSGLEFVEEVEVRGRRERVRVYTHRSVRAEAPGEPVPAPPIASDA